MLYLFRHKCLENVTEASESDTDQVNSLYEDTSLPPYPAPPRPQLSFDGSPSPATIATPNDRQLNKRGDSVFLPDTEIRGVHGIRRMRTCPGCDRKVEKLDDKLAHCPQCKINQLTRKCNTSLTVDLKMADEYDLIISCPGYVLEQFFKSTGKEMDLDTVSDNEITVELLEVPKVDVKYNKKAMTMNRLTLSK